MPDLLDIYNTLGKAPANAAGADSVSPEYRNPFEEFISTTKKTPVESAIENFNEKVLEAELPKSKQYSTEDYESFIKYGLSPTEVSDYDTLVKQRAKNQSVAEQTWNSLVRAIGSEIGVGTVKGFVDIFDFINQTISNIDKGIGKELNFDPNNSTLAEWSNYLQSVKEDIDKKHQIYRTNPNDPLDWKSFSWYADNFPSVATTISLMVPSYTLMKGASLIGKGASALLNKIPKFTTLADKTVKAINFAPRTQEILNTLGKSTFMGLNSRIAENYQEAQQTYNKIKDVASKYLVAMTEEQREEWDKLNPEYKGMDDEEIANNIANAKANLTFKEDFSNLGFDILQIYTLHNLLRSPRISIPRSLKTRNAKIANLFKEGKEVTDAALKTTGFKNIVLEKGKNFLYDSATLARAEWTEGVEEGINFIAQEDALYATQALFGDYPYNREEATIKQFGIIPYGLNEQQFRDYVHNPEMWEQFIWGAIGGILFGGVYNKAVPYMQQKFGKQNNIQDKQKELSLLARNNIQQQYLNNIDLIKQNKNPFNLDKDGNPQDFITDEERNAVVNLVQQQFLNDLVLNANQNGTIDLLQSYFENQDTIEGYSNRIGEQESRQLQKEVLDAVNKITPIYNKNFNNVRRNGGDNAVSHMLARQYTNAEIVSDFYDRITNIYLNKLNDNVSNSTIENLNITKLQDAYLTDYINKLTFERDLLNDNKDLIKAQKEQNIADLNNRIEIAKNLLSSRNVFQQVLIDENTKETYTKFDKEAYSEAVQELNSIYDSGQEGKSLILDMVNYLTSALDTNYIKQDKNKTQKQIKQDIKSYKDFENKAVQNIKKKAAKDFRNLVNEYGSDEIVNALNENENNLSEKDKETLDNVREVITPDEQQQIINIENAIKKEAERKRELNDAAAKNDVENLGIGEHSRFADEARETNDENNPFPVEENGENNPLENEQKVYDENIIRIAENNRGNATSYRNLLKGIYETTTQGDYVIEQLKNQINDNNSIINQVASYLGVDNSEEEKEKALDFLNNFEQAYVNSDSRFSNELSAVNTTLFNTLMRTNKENFEKFLDAVFDLIIKTDNYKTYPAYRHNDQYFITGKTLRRLMTKFGYNRVSEDLYDALVIYIKNNYRKKFVIVDANDLLKIKKEDFINYGSLSWIKRELEIEQNPSNSVSIDKIDLKNAYPEFVKLNKDDELVAVYNNGNVEIRTKRTKNKDSVLLGYMASPERDADKNTYTGVNKLWIYQITPNSSTSKISCPLRDAIVNLFRTDDKTKKRIKFKYNGVETDLVDFMYKFDLTLSSYDLSYTNKEEKEKAEENKKDLINALYERFMEIGFDKFAYNLNKDYSIEQKLSALRHIANIISSAFEADAVASIARDRNNNTEENEFQSIIFDDINRWFIKVYNGYNIAYNIANKTKNGKNVSTTVRIEDIGYGYMNQDGSFNEITKTVVGYNNADNKLYVGTKDDVTNTYYLEGGSERIVFNSSVGVPYMKIRGNNNYAQIRQNTIKNINNKDIDAIKDTASYYFADLIYNFIFNKQKSLRSLSEELTEAFSEKGLFRVLTNKTDKKRRTSVYYDEAHNSLYINYVKDGRDQKIVINSFNDTGNERNIILTDFELNEITENNNHLVLKYGDNNKNIYGFSNFISDYYKENNLHEKNKKIIKEKFLDIINNSTFAIPIAFLQSDDVAEKDLNNRFVHRIKDGKKAKTIISFGKNKSFEYKSYQDFLVSTDAISIKLNNDQREKEINGNKVVSSGNFYFVENATRLIVNVQLKDKAGNIIKNEPSKPNAKIDNLVYNSLSPLSERIGSVDELSLSNLLNENRLNFGAIEEFVNSSTEIDETDKENINQYLNKIRELGLFSSKIKLIKSNKTKAFSKYNKIEDTVYIYTNKVLGTRKGDNALTLDDFLKRIIHENIHAYIFNSFDVVNREKINPNANKISRSTKERMKFFKQLGDVYNQVDKFLDLKEIEYDGKKISIIEYLNLKSEENGYNFTWDENKLRAVTIAFRGYKNDSNSYNRIEEFIAESITNDKLIYLLNAIDAEEIHESDKEETLLEKILRIIYEFLGININKNSLLYELQNIYREYDKYKSYTLNEESEEEIVEEPENITEESQEEVQKEPEQNNEANNLDDFGVEDFFNGDDNSFSRFSNSDISSITSLNSIFEDRLDTSSNRLRNAGEISFTCM